MSDVFYNKKKEKNYRESTRRIIRFCVWITITKDNI